VLSGGEGGSILEDATAINILTAAKTLGNKIAEKQKIAEATEGKIDEARSGEAYIYIEIYILYTYIYRRWATRLRRSRRLQRLRKEKLTRRAPARPIYT